MKIALVHDQLNEFGGAERVLLALSQMYPDAPIYTAYYRRGSPAWERFKDRDIRVSWMQPLWRLASPLRFLAPAIWRSFDFSSYDVVISSSSWYVTKGFERNGNAVEICYCHTPPRWLYGYETSRKQTGLVKVYGAIVGFFMRQYDFHAAQRVNYFIANSRETQRRIQKFYRRDATVVYPPIDIYANSKTQISNQIQSSKFKTSMGYYLVVSRLAQAKHVDEAIAAANQLNIPLKIAGTGVEEKRLRAMAGKTVEFLGYISDSELGALYAGAKAFLALATDEDFGMTPVEAQAYGTPVIARRAAGYLESVVEGKTGIFFDGDLVSAIQQFERKKFKSADCIAQAKKFGNKRFKQQIQHVVQKQYLKK